MVASFNRILVTGGGTFLGNMIAMALLAEGAKVTLLVPSGAEEKLGVLKDHTQWWTADLWDSASMRGRARGHGVVIHTVGSMLSDPARGLTYHRMNFVSARNAATMCISDGVPRMILMSAARASWLSRSYLRSKREAEQYLRRVGVTGIVIRAPLVYVRTEPRPAFFRLMTLLGSTPPISWFGFSRTAPMPVDILALAVARIATESFRTKTVYYAPDLRRLLSRAERAQPLIMPQFERPASPETPRSIHPIESLGEDTPFGWMPPSEQDR